VGSIDHADLVVSSLEGSLPFYRGLLEPLGYTDVGEIEGERGERVVYLSRGGILGAVGLRERQAREGESFERYALGLHHLAIAAPDRRAVDRVGVWAEREGVEIESPPREYDYTPGYYAVFLHDPDGLKLEVVHR
jgi:catechol 2,3-dioxygenase-like lactoylglutathione lyase family enzyme